MALSPDTFVRIHWAGKKRLATDARAYYFNRLLDLPESGMLKSRTLDKLATAPWRLAGGELARTNPYSVLLRPLLNDIAEDECYLEIRQATNEPKEFVFAIQLDDQHAGLWETNLANVMASLTGVWPNASRQMHGWTLVRPQYPQCIELTRAGEWTLVGVSRNENKLLRELLLQIQRSPEPFGSRATDPWLQVHLDLPRLEAGRTNPVVPVGVLPRVFLTLSGDGGNVLAHGELNFPQPLPIQLEPWTFPTHRILEPLVSFSAARGFQRWLEWWKPWNDARIGPPPDQLCSWTPDGLMLQAVLAAPNPAAADQVNAVTALLLGRANLWLTNNGLGQFEVLPESKGVIWTGLPYISPFVRSVDDGRMILCALDPSRLQGTNTQEGINYRPPLAELIQHIMSETNLVAYDWELTGPRIESCLFIGQLFRQATRCLPLPMESASVRWLSAVKDRVGNATTRVTRTGPNQLTFDRKATIGLTGAELSLLADWLESPQFPWGLHTFHAPAQPAPGLSNTSPRPLRKPEGGGGDRSNADPQNSTFLQGIL